MRGNKLLTLAVAVTALSLGIVACGDDDEGGGGGGGDASVVDLTIGVLVPLTGDLSAFGPAGQKAAQIAVEEANKALQDSGSDAKVTLEVADTETSDTAGPQAAKQLIGNGAGCMSGAWASSVTIPTGTSVNARQSVPLISPASTSPEITGLNDNGMVFRTAPSDALQGQVLAVAVGDQFGSDAKVSVAARNDPYGEGIANEFATAWEDNGGSLTGEPVLYDPEASTYNSEAEQIVSGNPDAFVIIDFEDPYGKVGAALARTGGFDASKLWTADGLAFDGDGNKTGIPDTIPSDALYGASGTRPATPEGSEASDAFNTLYRDSNLKPADRNTFDAQNFDTVMLCFLASVAAGSAEGADIAEQIQNVASAPGDEYDLTDLAGAVEALQNGDDIDYQGTSGTVDLDDAGDPVDANYEVWSYDDKGVFSVQETVEKSSE